MQKKSVTKRILPIDLNIPFTYNGKLALSLAATLGNSEKHQVWEWLFSEFTQLICEKRISQRIRHDFFHVYVPHNPFIKTKYKVLMKRLWVKPEKILKHVIGEIKKGNYVSLRLDLFFLQSLNLRDPGIHMEHIFGFDESKEVLYLMRCSKSRGVYVAEISFDEFKKAYTPLLGKKQKLIVEYKRAKKKQKYVLDKKFLIRQIKNYAYSSFSVRDFIKTQWSVFPLAWDFPFGKSVGMSSTFQVKNILTLELNEQLSSYSGYLSSRTRLHAIYEFKSLMLKRLEFLLEENILLNDDVTVDCIKRYGILCEKYLSIRNKYLKFQITHKKDSIRDLVDEIQFLEAEEKNIFDCLLPNLIV